MIYHYYAMYQSGPNSTMHIDGILNLEEPVKDMEDYAYVKELISPDHHDILTIVSLTVLDTHEILN